MSDEEQWLHDATKHHLNRIDERLEEIMADITKLDEGVKALSGAVETAVTQLGELKGEEEKVTALEAEVAAEKAKVAELESSSGSPSQEQVDELTSTVEGDKSKLEGAGA